VPEAFYLSKSQKVTRKHKNALLLFYTSTALSAFITRGKSKKITAAVIKMSGFLRINDVGSSALNTQVN
jgi:hypothetical protein